MLCPQCNVPLMRAGTEEYISLTSEATGTVKTRSKWVCLNPLCSMYAGDPNNPLQEVSIEYQKGDKKVIEHDKRQKVNLSNIRIVAHTSETTRELPVEGDIKQFAERVVMELNEDESMILATKLSEKAVKGGDKPVTPEERK
jgi:hypothetical protein